MRGIGDKIVSRHPHVFASGRLDNADQVLRQWEQLKRTSAGAEGRLDVRRVPGALPALLKALRISSKAARVGFDWSDAAGVWTKIEEEMAELGEAVRRGDREAVAEEIGDLLFTIANLARHEEVDPEQALQAANRKFIERFRYVEEAMARDGARPAPAQRIGWRRCGRRRRPRSEELRLPEAAHPAEPLVARLESILRRNPREVGERSDR